MVVEKPKWIIVEIDKDKFNKARKWSREAFGMSMQGKEKRWANMIWYCKFGKFYFKDPEHATMFRLVWA